jgi:hypothetical protein
MTSDKSSDKKQPPQKPTSPLPSEDPKLMLSISANRPLPTLDTKEDIHLPKPSKPMSSVRRRRFPIATYIVVLIVLLVALYFLFQYLR